MTTTAAVTANTVSDEHSWRLWFSRSSWVMGRQVTVEAANVWIQNFKWWEMDGNTFVYFLCYISWSRSFCFPTFFMSSFLVSHIITHPMVSDRGRTLSNCQRPVIILTKGNLVEVVEDKNWIGLCWQNVDFSSNLCICLYVTEGRCHKCTLFIGETYMCALHWCLFCIDGVTVLVVHHLLVGTSFTVTMWHSGP